MLESNVRVKEEAKPTKKVSGKRRPERAEGKKKGKKVEVERRSLPYPPQKRKRLKKHLNRLKRKRSPRLRKNELRYGRFFRAYSVSLTLWPIKVAL